MCLTNNSKQQWKDWRGSDSCVLAPASAGSGGHAVYGPCHFIIQWFHRANLNLATAGLSVPWKSASITKKKYFILLHTYLDSIIPLQKEAGMKREGEEKKNSVVNIYFQISDL